MEELLALGASDATVGAGLAVGDVAISAAVEADSFEGAFREANELIGQAIRSAQHEQGQVSIDWRSATATRIASPEESLRPSA